MVPLASRTKLNKLTDRAVDMVLDSGAYSCWKRHEELTLAEYIKFIHENESSVVHSVNLDTIPGEWGKVPSPLQVEESAKKSFDNLMLMRKEGIEAMPVFHQGENIAWLEKMVDSGYDYIGISPANDRTTKQKIEWLDEIFGCLCGSSGYPSIKTHGFGVTAIPIMFRYPWYSADSITWLLPGSYGGVLIPYQNENGVGYDYSRRPMFIQFSEREKRKKAIDGFNSSNPHYKALGAGLKAYIDSYLHKEKLWSDALPHHYGPRVRVTCRFLKNAFKDYTPPPFVKRSGGFFSETKKGSFKGQSEAVGKFRLIYTIPLSPGFSEVLHQEQLRDQLVSYYYFKHGMKVDLAEYVKTGLLEAAVDEEGVVDAEV